MTSRDPTPSPEPELHASIQSAALIDSYTYFSTDLIISNASSSTSNSTSKGKRKVSELEDVESSSNKGKGKEVILIEKVGGGETIAIPGQWMLGVDEAGRGPVLGLSFSSLVWGCRDWTEWYLRVLGPQVYGIAFCPIEYVDELKELGFAGKFYLFVYFFSFSRNYFY